MLHDMANGRKLLFRSLVVLILLGGVLAGGWAAYMWYIYSHNSGLTKVAKGKAYKMTKTVKITPLRGGLYMLQGDGGNITALVGDDGILIVDSDEAWMAPKIAAALKTLSDQPVRYVINTHFHGDHRGGNGHFALQGAEIIAHANTLGNMLKDTYSRAEPADMPTLTFDTEYSLVFNGEEVRLLYLPNAHTDSDIIVLFKNANVVATGDVFSFGSYPFISTGTHGTIGRHIEAQQEIAALTDSETLIVPGHGDLARKPDLLETNERLASIRDYVVTLKGLGISRSLARGFYPTYAWRADWRNAYVTDKMFLALVYNTLPE